MGVHIPKCINNISYPCTHILFDHYLHRPTQLIYYSPISKPSSSSSSSSNNSEYSSEEEDIMEEKPFSVKDKITKRIERLTLLKSKEKEKKDNKNNKKRNIIHKQKINTSIINISLCKLNNEVKIESCDPYYCNNCKSILSKYDKLLKIMDDIKLDSDDNSIWICNL